MLRNSSPRAFAAISCAACLSLATTAVAADAVPPQTRWEQPHEPMPIVDTEAAAKPDAPPAFTVPAGFAVDRLFVVPQESLGSWVCLATDPKGRIIASDQGGRGLVRITPAPLDGSATTVVEKIPADISGAQGLLWAFDALYVVRNGGVSVLYRVTDSDGDDRLDKVEKLRGFAGGGEHGPHALRLSPDGQRLFVICGNHTKLPFAIEDLTPPQTMGGIRGDQRRVKLPADGTSRLPANWDEDQIITRMWDSNGHAAGILAPGGYVASTDRDGKAWEVWSGGYRNPYDMAFNADGELFVCDWTFGTMYAIHLEPAGATYRGVKEEFLARTPLPLTDMVVGADGAIYFAVGGRGGQSELYRVRYEGNESTAPVDARDTTAARERNVRHELESLHRLADDPAPETPDQITIVTDPEDATKFVQVPRTDVEEIVAASESLMPKGLLDQLNETEVLDLIAYTLSRGSRHGPRFKKD